MLIATLERISIPGASDLESGHVYLIEDGLGALLVQRGQAREVAEEKKQTTKKAEKTADKE